MANPVTIVARLVSVTLILAALAGSSRPASADSGWARVYPIDPRDSLVLVPLDRLSEPGDALVGTNVEIVPETGPAAFEPTGFFVYEPDGPDRLLFDQASVYWHVDHYVHDVLGTLGYPGLPFPIVARLRDTSGQGNTQPALASDRGIWLYLNDGVWNDPCRAADLVVHEAQHVVTLQYIRPTTAEGFAYNEGTSDYFAAVATGDPVYGEWLYGSPDGVTRVDSSPDVFHYRNFDQVSYGGLPVRDPHSNGMIWSGALWDLRGRLGRLADSLVVESLPYLPPSPALLNGAQAVLAADLERRGGRHAATIESTFARRGLDVRTLFLRIGGSPRVRRNERVTFTAAVYGLPPYRYTWRVRPWHGETPGPWRDVGTDSSLAVHAVEDFEVGLHVIDRGIRVGDGTARVAVESPEPRPDPPFAWITGPERLVAGEPGTFVAHATGAGPFAFRWFACCGPAGSTRRALGDGPRLTLTDTGSFSVLLVARDRYGRLSDTTWTTVAVDPRAVTALSLTPEESTLRRGTPFTARWEAPPAARARLDLYDVTGRRVATAYEGPGGARRSSWSTAEASPGLYFATLRAGASSRVARVIVLP